jgi:streptomycin 6-kinase
MAESVSEKLEHYLKTWELSDPQLLAETASSHVYIVMSNGVKVVLKLLTPLGAEESTGAAALRHFAGEGAVRLLRHDDEAHLLEYVDGEDLIPLVQQGKDDEATAIIGDVLNKLHASTRAALPDGITPLNVWFRELFKKAEEDSRAGHHSIYVRGAHIAEGLLAEPRDVYVLHGDIHHENIRHHAQRGWLAFDPKGLIGERTFDAVNPLRNPMDMPTLVFDEARLLKTAEILSQKLNLELSRLLTFTFAFTCLSASWIFYSGDEPVLDLKIAEMVEPHLPR